MARAFHEIGHRFYRYSWHESRGDNEPDEPEEPDDDCDAETENRYELAYEEWEQACAQAEFDFQNRWNTISRIIAQACEAGTLVSAVRAKEGGEMIWLDAHYWNAENVEVRFFRCDLSFANPFGESRFGRTHWIYVTRDSLDKHLRTLGIDLVSQLGTSEDNHQAASDSLIRRAMRPQEPHTKSRGEVSEARIREELKKIYADPANGRPNMNKACNLLRARLPKARSSMVMSILREPLFATQRRSPGNQPKSKRNIL